MIKRTTIFFIVLFLLSPTVLLAEGNTPKISEEDKLRILNSALTEIDSREDPFSVPSTVEETLTKYQQIKEDKEKEEDRKKEIIENVRLLLEKEKLEAEKLELLKEQQREQQEAQLKEQESIRMFSSSNTSKEPTIGEDSIGGKEIVAIAHEMANKYQVPVNWILAVIDQESGFQTDAVNGSNSNGTIDRGLMQLNSNTAPYLAKSLNIPYYEGLEFSPSVNIEMGTYFLSTLKKKSFDLHYIFTSYNRGEGGAKNLYERQGSFESDYSNNVIEKTLRY